LLEKRLGPSSLKGGGTIHHPVALLLAFKAWPCWAAQLRAHTGPVTLEATSKTWAESSLGFFWAMGARSWGALL
jgi:hypothetical protein